MYVGHKVSKQNKAQSCQVHEEGSVLPRSHVYGSPEFLPKTDLIVVKCNILILFLVSIGLFYTKRIYNNVANKLNKRTDKTMSNDVLTKPCCELFVSPSNSPISLSLN